MTVVNLRGTNGSGKSTIVKKFLQRYPYTEVFGSAGPRRPEAYKVRLPGRWLYVIGPYLTATGGCDALSLNGVELTEVLNKYKKLGHVIFESVVLSTYFGAVGEWLRHNKEEVIVVFLDTPLNVCLESIKARTGPYSRTKNVAAKIRAIESVQERMSVAGITTKTLSREIAFEKIVEWLK
jgi:hypothetical protein